MRARAVLLAVVTVAGMALAGCDRSVAASGGGDQLGSLEASVDAISRQVDSDATG